MSTPAQPRTGKIALYTRIIVLIVLVVVLRDAYVRRKSFNLSQAITRNDWRLARTFVSPGISFADEAEEVHAFRLAAAEGDTEMLNLMAKRNSVYPQFSKTSRDGLLFESIDVGHLVALQCLIDAGQDVNTVTDFGSALERAVISHQPGAAKLLKEHGAHFLPGEAAVNGDIVELEKANTAGFDPNQPAPSYMGDGSYAVLTARGGHADTLAWLIKHGADLKQTYTASERNSKEKLTILHAAAESGNPEVVNALVKMGFDVNVRGKLSLKGPDGTTETAGTTPLMRAAFAGNTDTVEALLKLHASADIALSDGRNALSYAIAGAPSDIVAPPMTSGAGPEAPQEIIDTAALTKKNKIRRKRILTLLLAASPGLAASTPGIIASACSAGMLDIVPALAAGGAAVNGRVGRMAPPLIAVMEARNSANLPAPESQRFIESIAISLIGKGADVNGADGSGVTPLMSACSNNLPHTVEAILSKGGNLAAVDSKGKSVRDYAFAAAGKVGVLSESRAELLAVLKGHGIQLSFLEALQFNSLQDVTTMLDKGQNPNQTFVLSGKEIPGYEAQYTVPANRASTGKMVAAAVSSLSAVTPLMLAAGSGYIDLMKVLLAHHANVNATDSRGWTALANAAEYNKVEAAKLLIASGAAVEARDKRQWTVLMIAAGAGSLDCVKLLVEAGATIEAKDVNGFTPLARACTAGSVDVAQYLIDRHANVNATNTSGKGMIYLARNRHHDNVVDLLRKYHALEQAAPDNTIPQK